MTFASVTTGALLLSQPPALANPAGGTVVDGSAAISRAGSAATIDQPSDKATLDGQGFSVGANGIVDQPSVTAAPLGRGIGNGTSVISEALNANGQVFAFRDGVLGQAGFAAAGHGEAGLSCNMRDRCF